MLPQSKKLHEILNSNDLHAELFREKSGNVYNYFEINFKNKVDC